MANESREAVTSRHPILGRLRPYWVQQCGRFMGVAAAAYGGWLLSRPHWWIGLVLIGFTTLCQYGMTFDD